MNNAMTYSVFKTLSGLYVAEEICELYNVGDETERKVIKEIPCYKVTEIDLNTINEKARREGDQLIADIVTIFDLQLVLSFTVYRDTNHDNKLYVFSNTCDKYGVTSNEKRIIKNQTYYHVTEDDITKIELKTKEEKIAYKRKYIDISLEDEVKPAEYLFMCYVDFETKKNYIKREMYELLKQKGIEIEGEPRIIYGKNCYSITESQLKEAEKTINYRRVEQLLRPAINSNPEIKDKMKEVAFPKIENLQKVIDRAREFALEMKKKRENLIKTTYNTKVKNVMDTIVIKDDDPTDDVEQYKEKLKEIMDSIVIEEDSETMNKHNERIQQIMDTIVIEDDDPTDDVEEYKERLKEIMDSIVIDDETEINNYNEQIKNIMDTIVIDDDVDHYKDELKKVMDTIVIHDDSEIEYSNKIKEIMDTIVIEDDDPTDDVDQYKEELKRIIDTIVIDEEPQEKVIIYKDKKTDILYAPISNTDNSDDTVNIMHKQCRELTEEDLENMRNKKIITVSVYPIDKKEYDIIICNNNGQLYISQNILEELGFYIDNPHRISVNKEIYEEITYEDLDLIKAKESDSCHINITMKQITPKRG